MWRRSEKSFTEESAYDPKTPLYLGIVLYAGRLCHVAAEAYGQRDSGQEKYLHPRASTTGRKARLDGNYGKRQALQHYSSL